MEPFASLEQYEARFGAVACDERHAVTECLDDASAAMRAALDRAGVDYSEPDEDMADRLMRTCRAAANRLAPRGGDVPPGVTQATAGPYTQSYTYQPAYGTPRLLPSELAMMGLGGGTGRTLRPACGVSRA